MGEALDAERKKADAGGSWQKVNVDFQIVAIAKVAGAGEILSDDADVERVCKWAAIRVTKPSE